MLPASRHDITYFKELSVAIEADLVREITVNRLSGRHFLGDTAYISDPFQLTLLDQLDVEVQTPMRTNQTDWKPYRWDFTLTRRRNETTFVQLCDETRMKLNRAKRVHGVASRVVTKLLARTMRQRINVRDGHTIAQTKHALDG